MEEMARALRVVNDREAAELIDLLRAVNEYKSVRVPRAYKERLSLEVLTRTVRRAVASARLLQSGLEREFFELLSRAGQEAEFQAQPTIPVDLAAREGVDRRSVVVIPDFAHRTLPYVVFLDGRGVHSSERALADDAEITAELQHMGFVVRRFRTQHLEPGFHAQTIATLRRDIEQFRSARTRRSII